MLILTVNVYIGNDLKAEQCTQDTKYVEVKYTEKELKYTLYLQNLKDDPCGKCTCSPTHSVCMVACTGEA